MTARIAALSSGFLYPFIAVDCPTQNAVVDFFFLLFFLKKKPISLFTESTR